MKKTQLLMGLTSLFAMAACTAAGVKPKIINSTVDEFEQKFNDRTIEYYEQYKVENAILTYNAGYKESYGGAYIVAFKLENGNNSMAFRVVNHNLYQYDEKAKCYACVDDTTAFANVDTTTLVKGAKIGDSFEILLFDCFTKSKSSYMPVVDFVKANTAE